MPCAAIRGEALFELREQWAANEAAAVEDAFDCPVELGSQRLGLSSEIEERNAHDCSPQ